MKNPLYAVLGIIAAAAVFLSIPLLNSHLKQKANPYQVEAPDEFLKAAILQEILTNREIETEDFEIEVEDGEVTLEGSVPDPIQANLAEQVAIDQGAEGVENLLTVTGERYRTF